MSRRLAWVLTLALIPAACGSAGRRPTPSGQVLSSSGGDFAGIHNLPGGVRVLASGTLPNGQRFRVATKRYQFRGRLYDDLEALLGSGSSSFLPRQMPGPLAFSAAAQCGANPELLIYGVLRDPAERVAFHARGHVFPLSRARTANGETVVYGPAVGSGSVVLSVPGRTVASYHLPSIAGCQPGSLVSTMIATH